MACFGGWHLRVSRPRSQHFSTLHPQPSTDIQCKPQCTQLWRDEPEEFILEEEQRKPDDDIRAAAEGLFLAIFDARRELIGASHFVAVAGLVGAFEAWGCG